MFHAPEERLFDYQVLPPARPPARPPGLIGSGLI